jgi:hypothetical protein
MAGVLLTQHREALAAYVAGFDAAFMTPTVAEKIVADAVAMTNMLGVIKAAAAACVSKSELWRRGGDKTAAQHLARIAGTGAKDAADTIATGQRLDDMPELDAAARAGELSPQQTAAIADAVAANPAVERRLVEKAKSSSLPELRDECARAKAAADPDPEARRQRIHCGRKLRTWTDPEGVGHLHVNDNPEVIAEIMGVVDPIRDRIFSAARAAGRREAPDAYGVDALVEAVCGRTGEERPTARRTAPAKVIFRVDLPAFLRGYPVDGEVIEIAGFGPVAASAVRDLLDTGDPIIAAVLTNGVDVVNVAHLTRKPRAHQRTALEWLYPTCAVAGCTAMAHLDIDHQKDWAKTLVTWLKWLDRLCKHHHRMKTREGWALVAGKGKRVFVPPDDPRHPDIADIARSEAA